MEKIIRALKNNKAKGKSGVSNEMLKYSVNHIIIEPLTETMNWMINRGIVPTSFNIGVISTILKDQSGSTTKKFFVRTKIFARTSKFFLFEQKFLFELARVKNFFFHCIFHLFLYSNVN